MQDGDGGGGRGAVPFRCAHQVMTQIIIKRGDWRDEETISARSVCCRSGVRAAELALGARLSPSIDFCAEFIRL